MRFGEIVRPLRARRLLRARAAAPSTPRRVCMTVVPAVVAGVEEIVRVHAAAGRRLDPARRCCTRPAGRAPPTWPRPAARRPWRPWPTAPSRSRGSTASSGPGNVYVTEAKRQVAGFVGIDGLAGPSELAIVADGDVDPRMAALDLIAQAEHDPRRGTFFVTPDPALIEKVDEAFEQELAAGRAPRDRRAAAAPHEGDPGARPRPGRRGGERPRGRARAAAAGRSRRVPAEGAQRRRGVPRALDARCPFGDYGVASQPRAADGRHRAVLAAACAPPTT